MWLVEYCSTFLTPSSTKSQVSWHLFDVTNSYQNIQFSVSEDHGCIIEAVPDIWEGYFLVQFKRSICADATGSSRMLRWYAWAATRLTSALEWFHAFCPWTAGFTSRHSAKYYISSMFPIFYSRYMIRYIFFSWDLPSFWLLDKSPNRFINRNYIHAGGRVFWHSFCLICKLYTYFNHCISFFAGGWSWAVCTVEACRGMVESVSHVTAASCCWGRRYSDWPSTLATQVASKSIARIIIINAIIYDTRATLTLSKVEYELQQLGQVTRSLTARELFQAAQYDAVIDTLRPLLDHGETSAFGIACCCRLKWVKSCNDRHIQIWLCGDAPATL